MSNLLKVGSSGKKRKQSDQVKKKKKAVKRKKTTPQAVKCLSCGQDGHTTASSQELCRPCGRKGHASDWRPIRSNLSSPCGLSKTTTKKNILNIFPTLLVGYHYLIASSLFQLPCRKKKSKEDAIIDHHGLTLENFSYEETTANYRPTFVDPGRKTVFTAAIGLETNRHEIRRCSTKEYYHMT
ncbi:hypothetical protein BDF20DRAFT_889110, partial [Mycotypha africana]|uniref:uncharacterized protein n=1 Tax=Mycotypha africana TaxID=64632 RepID=UPI0023016F7E